MSWKKVDPPKKKADWAGKSLELRAELPKQHFDWAKPLPIQPGDVVKILRRRSWSEAHWLLNGCDISAWPHERVIEASWICPHCDHPHHLIIPESWIAEGKVYFVEAEE